MVKSLSPSMPLSSSNSIPGRMEKSVHRAYYMCEISEGKAEWYFTTVSHQVLMEVKQLFSDVIRAGTLLLLILKVQQHVDLQKHMWV